MSLIDGFTVAMFSEFVREIRQLEWNRQSAIRLMLHVVVVILNFVFFCRYDISFKTISGKAKSVTEEMTAPWLETTLPTILSRYPLENIFNGDEFGLFFQRLRNITFHFKKEKCSRGKHSKVRLTGMAAGNTKGERLPMFVIGKSKNPRCFKGVKRVPCRYRAQQGVGCRPSYLKSGLRNSTEILVPKRGESP